MDFPSEYSTFDVLQGRQNDGLSSTVLPSYATSGYNSSANEDRLVEPSAQVMENQGVQQWSFTHLPDLLQAPIGAQEYPNQSSDLSSWYSVNDNTASDNGGAYSQAAEHSISSLPTYTPLDMAIYSQDTFNILYVPPSVWWKLAWDNRYATLSLGRNLIVSHSAFEGRAWEIRYTIPALNGATDLRILFVCNDEALPGCNFISQEGYVMQRHLESAPHMRAARMTGLECQYCGWCGKTGRQDILRRHQRSTKCTSQRDLGRQMMIGGAHEVGQQF